MPVFAFDLKSKIVCALKSSRKDISFDTAFVSVAPLFTELDRGAKNAPPGLRWLGLPPGRGRVNIYLHSDQLKPNSYLKLFKKYIFSEGEEFPLRRRGLTSEGGTLTSEGDKTTSVGRNMTLMGGTST